MRYSVEITTRAEKALRALDKPVRRRVLTAIDHLADAPRPRGCVKLTGSDTWRIRVGDWRILYDIYDTELRVLVIDVDHRSKIYKHP